MINVAVFMMLANIVGYWFYRNAEKIRVREIEMRNKGPFKFKILGFSKKSLDDSKTWVRQYRIFVVIVCSYFNLLGFWFFMTVK